MGKIRLLVIDVGNAGVGKFRFTDPHIMLQNNFVDEFHVDIVANPPLHDKNFYQNYDAVFAQGSMVLNEGIFKVFENLKKEGIKIILDLDDYWRLPMSHALYQRMEKSYKTLTSRLSVADLITTTTKYLAGKISKYNRNVVVLSNAVNPKESQFIPKKIESERIRITYIGGSSHQEDLKYLRGIFGKLFTSTSSMNVKTQMVLCGFNNQSRNINTGEITKEKFPKVWMECEHIFTNGYMVDEDYQHYLLHPIETEYPNVEDKPYRRIWTKDISQYGTCYNHADIVLAPLVDNEFNQLKSQLKVIEAGFHKKPLIVSDILPYQLDCINEKNSLVVQEGKAHKDWFKNIKRLVTEPNLCQDLGEALYETVKDKYDLNRITKLRRQVYQNLFKID